MPVARVREARADTQQGQNTPRRMAFFRPIASPVPSGAYSPPIWTGPSQHALPAVIPIRAVLGASEETAVALDMIRPHQNGLELIIVVATRRPITQVLGVGWPPWHPAAGPGHLRIGLAFADGRVAGDQPDDLFRIPRDTEGLPFIPVIIVEGVSTASHQFSLRAWCWPLPPAGPLRVVVEWLDQGLSEVELEIDGERLVVAAKDTVQIFDCLSAEPS